ncbi:phosphotransferase [Spirilliplanes yamanashiensis]|uniref:Aminoglycoside phosphotransferase domain-containing protein n=1 Tax=Spirilliplanes yamanashiensis TaxID=42233 RepID=A0A8J4DIC1_9ACTN|nr:phosphotransferase [Spirilliplanes yamanashiensis]MDP9817412.1 aminoglycoside phosphotransferase (APT) family kinase protein [Spirilliplanes yamanashiensis]GIJ02937.1 hypothetical protein Sya03_22890 [Spirilliplanes yamanashiensis]
MATQRMPAAEVDVSPGLARRLLRAQHPALAGLPLSPLANGWDNVLFRLGDDLVVRLPRRALAARLLAHELRWLPGLAPRLPLPVPAPVAAGRPGEGYPWPWSVAPYLPGDTATDTPPADPAAAASALGGFLAALHTPAPPDAPANPYRGVPLAARPAAFHDQVAALGDTVDAAAAGRAWAAALAAPAWSGPALWLHGDLHPGNIVVAGGRVTGVIDFGDVTAGDPATDLAVAWLLLPAAARPAFAAAYDAAAAIPADAATWARARGWALAMGVAVAAHSADNPRMAAMGRRTLAAVLG